MSCHPKCLLIHNDADIVLFLASLSFSLHESKQGPVSQSDLTDDHKPMLKYGNCDHLTAEIALWNGALVVVTKVSCAKREFYRDVFKSRVTFNLPPLRYRSMAPFNRTSIQRIRYQIVGILQNVQWLILEIHEYKKYINRRIALFYIIN